MVILRGRESGPTTRPGKTDMCNDKDTENGLE